MHCWWECRLVQPLWKTAWRYLKKLKMELSYDPAIPLLEIYPRKPQTLNICTPLFITVLFTIAKIWKQPQCPSVDEQIKTAVHLHNGILLSHKNEGNLTFCDSMGAPESIMLGEISQSKKDKYHPISLMCGI